MRYQVQPRHSGHSLVSLGTHRHPAACLPQIAWGGSLQIRIGSLTNCSSKNAVSSSTTTLRPLVGQLGNSSSSRSVLTSSWAVALGLSAMSVSMTHSPEASLRRLGMSAMRLTFSLRAAHHVSQTSSASGSRSMLLGVPNSLSHRVASPKARCLTTYSLTTASTTSSRRSVKESAQSSTIASGTEVAWRSNSRSGIAASPISSSKGGSDDPETSSLHGAQGILRRDRARRKDRGVSQGLEAVADDLERDAHPSRIHVRQAGHAAEDRWPGRLPQCVGLLRNARRARAPRDAGGRCGSRLRDRLCGTQAPRQTPKRREYTEVICPNCGCKTWFQSGKCENCSYGYSMEGTL